MISINLYLKYLGNKKISCSSISKLFLNLSVQLWKLTDDLQLINKKRILCHSGRKWILPIEGLIPSGGEIKDEVTGQFFKFNDDCKATFVTQKFGKGYLGKNLYYR